VVPRAAAFVLVAALVAQGCAARAPLDARVVGRVTGPAPALGPAAVFLESIEAEPREALPAVVVSQRDGRFEPHVAVTAVGQPVLFVNRDRIFQAAFSYSSPNAFECRALAPGDSCLVTFAEAGLVRVYSPLDADARAVVFVVPEQHHAVPDASGEFAIPGVAAGRYRITVWTESHGRASREISLVAGETARASFALEAR
jgi:plastocyanin